MRQCNQIQDIMERGEITNAYMRCEDGYIQTKGLIDGLLWDLERVEVKEDPEEVEMSDVSLQSGNKVSDIY